MSAPARPLSLLVGVLTAALLAVGVLPPSPAGADSITVQQALDEGAANAVNQQGVRTYAAVIDRATGELIARTDNADEQIASESVVKLFIAAYYLVRADGRMDADLDSDMHEMIVASDDGIASAYWTLDAIPAMAERYDLQGIDNPDSPGQWGAAKITAIAMAEFLFRMSRDPLVGPWLVPAMRETHDYGLDGYDQNFGFNRIDGAASKQGWGSDNWTDHANAVHSVGLMGRYAAAVLQTGPGGTYRTMGTEATETVRLLAEAPPPDAPAVDNSGRRAAGEVAGFPAGQRWWRAALIF